MTSRKVLMKINLQNKNDVFLFSEYLSEKKLILKILDIKQNKSFTGQVSDIELRAQAARIRLTYKDFINKIINAFFESVEECNFMYSLDEENGVYIFKWKSIDHEETIINLGNVPMTQQDYVLTFTDILLNTSKEMHELNLKIKILNSDLDESKSQTKKACDQLNEAITVKRNQEIEMFTKFSLVLNEKKKRIREISCNGNFSGLSRTKTLNRSIKPMPQKSKPHVLSSSEDEDVVLSKPGTSTKRNSLFFDDSESEPVMPVKTSKIRNRKQMVKTECSSPDQINMSFNPKSIPLTDSDSDEFLINEL